MRPYCLQLQSPAGVFAHSNTTAIWPRGHSGRRATATYAATRTVGMARIYRHHTTWTASSKLLHVQKPEPAHDDLGGQRAIWRRPRREGHPGKGTMGPYGLWNGATIRRAWRIPVCVAAGWQRQFGCHTYMQDVRPYVVHNAPTRDGMSHFPGGQFAPLTRHTLSDNPPRRAFGAAGARLIRYAAVVWRGLPAQSPVD